MVLSKCSAGRILLIVVSAVAVLFSLPYHLHATEAGPDWITGQASFNLYGDYNYTDGDQYTVLGNVLKEDVIADMNTSSFGFPNLLKQSYRVYPTSAGYFSSEYALPLGESRWQLVDGARLNSGYFPNPSSAGVLVKVSGTSAVRYVSDWRSMTSDLNASMHGAILRRFPADFSFESSRQLVRQDGTPIPVTEVSGVSYSKNGRYVYVNSLDGRMIVELPSMTHQAFAPYFHPNYSLSTAISNSGRYVVEGGKDIGLVLYDLAQCETSSICAKKDLTGFLRSEYSKTLTNTQGLGELSVVGIKFTNESSFDIYAWVTSVDSAGKYVHMQLSVDPGVQTMRYLALGDSFSSGEGAGDYYEATNFYAAENDYNFCHQSRQAYSEFLSTWLKPDFYDSVACSGAQIKDVVYAGTEDGYINSADSQAKNIESSSTLIRRIKQSNLPGYIPQLSLLAVNTPNIVTISIGGNDIGFGSIITSCVTNEQCYQSRDDRESLANLISSKIPKLAVTFTMIKRNMEGVDTKLYVVGYPQMFAERSCGQFMGVEEQIFANHLVDYLNAAIKLAAAQTGVYYIDVTNAFVDSTNNEDHRLCGNVSTAANGLFFDQENSTNGQSLLNTLFRTLVSSYHPNALGNQLLASEIRSQTLSFSNEMPLPVANSGKPSANIYESLVGDRDNANQELPAVSETITRDVVVERGQSLSVSYSVGNDTNGLPVENATITVVAQSTPVTFGTLSVQADNTVSGTFEIPSSFETGMHTIHLLFNDISGQAHDVYQYIFVIASSSDFDGDGISNSQESCIVGGTMDVDRDKDGIDDACDSEVAERENVAVPTNTSDVNSNEKASSTGGQVAAEQTSTRDGANLNDEAELALPDNIQNPNSLNVKLPRFGTQNQLKTQTPASWVPWVFVALGLITIRISRAIFGSKKHERLLK